MKRRLFICYEGEDRLRAKGFKLLRWNPNVDVEFVDRSLLDPVKSRDPAYIMQVIRERMKGTSLTVVLIGDHTHESEWVKREIEETIANGKGIIGVRLKDKEGAPVPQALKDAGAEVIDWNPDLFNDAFDRAVEAPAKIQRSMAKDPELVAACTR